MIKIVAINSKYVHTLLSPYYLKENCDYKNLIEIVQLNINQNIQNLYEKAMEGNPNIIAFPCYIFNINCVVSLVKTIKVKNPEITIIFGGPEASFEYDNLLELCDYLIVGEGEKAFNNLVSKLVNEKKDLPKVIVGENINLEEIKSPYSDDYFRDTEGKIAYFESSRGCPYNCAYCMSGDCGLKCFSLARTFEELEKFKGKNIRVLKFVDRTFNANKVMAKAIMKYLIANKEYFSFGFHFEIASDILDDEFISIVQASPKGLFQFEIGVQSFNEQTLKQVIRKTDVEKTLDNIVKMIKTGKSHIHTDLIAGLPFEDYESFKSGFNKLYAVNSDMLQLGFLKVLKGSRLKGMLDDEYIYEQTPPYEIIKTPYLNENEMLKLKYVEEACDKYHNSGIFKRTLSQYIGDDPFEFYLELGCLIYNKQLSLFERIDILFNFLTKNYDYEQVKCIMTMDYLENNNSRVLPKCLKFDYDKNFAKMLKVYNIDKKNCFAVRLRINPNTYEKGDFVLYVDYSKGYQLQFIDLKNFEKGNAYAN